MHRLLVALAVVCSLSCKKTAPDGPKPAWLALPPMPIEILVPLGATAAQTQESLDHSAPPGMIVSARECVLVVTPGSHGDAAKQETELATEHPGVTITRRDPPTANGSGLYLAYEYTGSRGDKVRSFRSEWTIGETTYRCEPFTGRADVACEEAACRSLRARPTSPPP